MRCSLSLRAIEKYTAEMWPIRAQLDLIESKRRQIRRERAMAQTTTAQIVRAVLNSEVAQFEAAVLALRELMEGE